jgi:hypothetical protein
MVRLSDIIKLEKPDVLSSRYGKAFEKAVLVLLKEKDVAVAMRAFIEHYGEPHTGAFAKLMKLTPWAKKVLNAEFAKYVELYLDDRRKRRRCEAGGGGLHVPQRRER